MISRFLLTLWAILGASNFSSSGLHAGELPPTAYPQWIESFSREYLVYDYMPTTRGPLSARLPNGDVVVATLSGGGLLLRRFGPNGAVRYTHLETLGSFSDVILRADAATDSVYVMTVASANASALLRFNGGLQREWSVEIPLEGYAVGDYFGMEVLSDGSAVSLRGSRLTRVARNATVAWFVDDFDDGLDVTASAMAVAADNTIWVVGSANSFDHHGDTTVMRYSSEGVRLSADHVGCTECFVNNTIDVDVLADGTATIVGGTGSSPGTFFARYDASGNRLIWTAPSDGWIYFARAIHDDSGSIYVFSNNVSPVLRRIDPVTAAIIWTRNAVDFTPLADGVLTTQTEASQPGVAGIAAVAFDSSGYRRWSRPLVANDNAKVSHGERNGPSVDFLLQDPVQTTSACSGYPHIISLDDKGSISTMPPVCQTSFGRADLRSFDAKPDIGVLVNLMYSLVAYAPDGDVRWQVHNCEWCELTESANPPWGSSMLAADGGAWAVERIQYSPTSLDGESFIKRFDAEGQEVLSIPTAEQDAVVWRTRMVASGQDVVLLQPVFYNGRSLTWQRIRADGIALPTHNYSIPDYDLFDIDAVRALDDGGISVVTKGEYGCTVGCSTHYVTILRLNADGTLHWRYQFPESDAAVTLAADGSVVAAVGRYLRKIGVNGQVSQVELSDPTLAGPNQLAGPVNGHWLLQAWRYPDQTFSLVDANGQVSATRLSNPSMQTICSANALGYLIQLYGTHGAELLDADSIATTAYFDFAGIADASSYGISAWQMQVDGSVYAAFTSYPEGDGFHVGMARFAVPGSPASDLLFRSGFD